MSLGNYEKHGPLFFGRLFYLGFYKLEKQFAYTMLTVKAVDEESRTISGMATTPEPDRVGDVVEPLGVQFKNPSVLLWMHRHDLPIGSVEFGKPTANGVPFTAKLPNVMEPSQLKARIDEAWQSVKAGIIRAVSIGFRPLEYSVIEETGGFRFTKSEIFELSLVSVPANSGATITAIKAFDAEIRASMGSKDEAQKSPSGSTEKKLKTVKLTPKEGKTMSISEKLKEWEVELSTKSAMAKEIYEKSLDDGESFDEVEDEKYQTLKSEIKGLIKHIKEGKELLEMEETMAVPVTEKAGSSEKSSNEARGGVAIVKKLGDEEQGIGFAKFALAMYAGKGNILEAKSFAEQKFGNDARLEQYMKAAVAAGTTTSPTWAGDLVRTDNLASEFLEFLRPRTILGQFGVGGVPSLRRIPFNVRIPGKTGTGTAAWVGEGYAKPVTSSAYDATEHKWAKIAAISVITEELDRFSDPSIQALVRDDLAEAVIERADTDFINPTKAVGTGASLSPASITNGVTPITATGDPEIDIPALWATADATNMPASSAVYITDSKTARQLSQYKTALGNRLYPNVTMTGGNIDGVPVIISNYVPQDTAGSLFILAFASEIYLSDDGQVAIDVSREASLVMDNAPNMDSGTPTPAQLVSMFQTNSMAIRAERYINWSKRRPQAVAYLDGVSWTDAA